jgi:hypothetical protein
MRHQSLQVCIVILIDVRWMVKRAIVLVLIISSGTRYKDHREQYYDEHHRRTHEKRNPGIHCHQKRTDRHRQGLSHKCCCVKVGERCYSVVVVSQSMRVKLTIDMADLFSGDVDSATVA